MKSKKIPTKIRKPMTFPIMSLPEGLSFIQNQMDEVQNKINEIIDYLESESREDK
jgi:hypothetical protein